MFTLPLLPSLNQTGVEQPVANDLISENNCLEQESQLLLLQQICHGAVEKINIRYFSPAFIDYVFIFAIIVIS